MEPRSRQLLGQVVTPQDLADLVATLCIRDSNARVLDPCVGEGALLLAAGRRLAALGAPSWHHQLYGVELDPGALARGRARIAEAAGAPPDEVSVVPGDFLALADGRAAREGRVQRSLWSDAGIGDGDLVQAQFDVAIMNPPYTRQEWLPRARKAGGPLGGRAGLHAHFFVALTGFIRQGGWLGAITPATWLAAAYGRPLRAFLLGHFRLHLIIAFGRDVFPDARVEACVAILQKCEGPSEAAARSRNPVRFLWLAKACRTDALVAWATKGTVGEPPRGCRLQVVPQGQLRAEGRWARFLDATAASPILSARPPITVPLSALVEIHRGITTGNNRVFLMSQEDAVREGIEKCCLWPFVRSPREITSLDTATVPNPRRLVVPRPGTAHPGLDAYLRRNGAGPSPYLQSARLEPAPLLFGYAVRDRKAFFANSAGLLAGDNFHCLHPKREEDLWVLFALLNAAPTALFLEGLGRAQGRGLLKVQRYELAELPMPDPACLSADTRSTLAELGEALRQSPAEPEVRAALDAVASSLLGFDPAETRRAEAALVAERRAHRLLPETIE